MYLQTKTRKSQSFDAWFVSCKKCGSPVEPFLVQFTVAEELHFFKSVWSVIVGKQLWMELEEGIECRATRLLRAEYDG